MKLKLAFLACTFALTTLAHASNVLPDSCGDAKTTFHISKMKSDGTVPPPAAGKAMLVFEYPVIWTGVHLGTGGGDLRVGMDGTWLGTAKSDSYFAVEVDPGEHHLCVTEAGVLGGVKKDGIGLASVNAEPGKTYFYQYKLTFQVLDEATTRSSSFAVTDEDDGRFQIKALKLSKFTKNN